LLADPDAFLRKAEPTEVGEEPFTEAQPTVTTPDVMAH